MGETILFIVANSFLLFCIGATKAKFFLFTFATIFLHRKHQCYVNYQKQFNKNSSFLNPILGGGVGETNLPSF